MQTGYFKSKLVDNIEQNECSENWKTLLNKKNTTTLWAFPQQQGVGFYEQTFPDDMAIASMLVTLTFDDGGRSFLNVHAVVTKFDGSDRELIITTLTEKLDLFSKMRMTLNNGHTPKNPLPQVTL